MDLTLTETPNGGSSRGALARQVAGYVRDLIVSGQLRGGEHLRTERLASELSVSATPVREALNALQSEGFVHSEPNRGFTVVGLSRQDVLDLFDMQAYLAGELAMRCTTRITSSGISRLSELQDQLRAAAHNQEMDEVERLNHDFHRTINLIADAPRLSWMLSTVVRYVPRRFFSMIGGWADASNDDHDVILSALAGGSAKTARDAMSAHVRHAGDLLVLHLAGQDYFAES